MSKNEFNRRKFLGAVGASPLSSALVTRPANASKEGKKPTKIGRDDIVVYNTDDRNHVINVVLLGPEGAVKYDRGFDLLGFNRDDGSANFESTFESDAVNVPTGKMYDVRVTVSGVGTKTLKWYVPEEGTQLIQLAIRLTPDRELLIRDSIM